MEIDERALNDCFFKIMLMRRIALQKRIGKDELRLGQFPILKLIKENPGCTQTFLSEKMHVTQASVALSTKRLQKAGLIDKETDEDNLRKNKLNITERGEQLCERHKAVHDELDRLAFEGISDTEKAALAGTLEKIISNISDGIDPSIKIMDIIALDNMTRKK